MTRHLSPDAFIAELQALAAADTRRLVALVGPPGAGKSTLAQRIVHEVSGSAVVAMDGFHYDDEVLVPRGWRPRKGAPHTFDVGGLAATLTRLRRRDEAHVAVPRFDRELEIARAGALLIPRAVPLIVVEGNWLLLQQPPWGVLAPLFDLTALIRVEEAELARRLRQRWVDYGLDETGIRAKLDDNDLPNGRLVYTGSRAVDIEIVLA